MWGRAANNLGRVTALYSNITYFLNVRTADPFFKLGHWNESDTTVSSVDVLPDGSVTLETATADLPLGTWIADEWFRLDLEFDLAAARLRGRKDSGAWSAYGYFLEGRLATSVQTYVLGRGADVRLDDWSVSSFPPLLAWRSLFVVK